MTAYALLFSRVVIGFIFALSSTNKIRNLSAANQTLIDFQMVPERLAPLAMSLLLVSEIMVTGLLLLGDRYVPLGFTLASALLILFSGVLVIALKRRLRIGCNCFGSTNTRVSGLDVVR